MLPILFHIVIPQWLTKPLLVLLVAVIALGRAFLLARQTRKEKHPVSFIEALRGDTWFIVSLVVGAILVWRGGLLDQTLRLPVHSYGLLLAIGFISAIRVAQVAAKNNGKDPELIADIGFWVLISALVGSRIFYIFVNWNDYFGPGTGVQTPWGKIPKIFAVWEGGLVFYGGFIAAAITAWWIFRQKKIAFLPYADLMIPSVALGHFFGRLGCFFAGCCWGDVAGSHLPWMVQFPPQSLAYQAFTHRPDPSHYLAPDRLSTLPLHPTQLYESFGELALFFLLVWVIRPSKKFDGQVLATWLMLYACLRMVIEFFRGDIERGVWLGLGAGQWTSIAIFATGLAIWLFAPKKLGETAVAHSRSRSH